MNVPFEKIKEIAVESTHWKGLAVDRETMLERIYQLLEHGISRESPTALHLLKTWREQKWTFEK